MKSALKNAARKGSELLPHPWRGKLNLALHDLPETLNRKYPISVRSGQVSGEGGLAQIASFGNLRCYRQWYARIFDDSTVVEEGTLHTRSKVIKLGEGNSEHDLILHPANSLTEQKFERAGWLLVPQYVNCSIDLKKPLEKILSSRDVKNEMRVIRKLGYSFKVLQSESALEEFYHEMLRPMEAERHGELTDKTDLEFLRQKFQKGFLLAAYLDSKWVGANFMVEESPGVIRSRHVGWRDGSQELLRQGRIVSALLQEVIRHVQEQGYTKLDLGSSNPFADDGPLIYKLKWVADIELPSALNEDGQLVDAETMTAVHFQLANQGARSILERTPVIAKYGDGLRVYGWDTPMRSEFKRQIEKGIDWVNLAEEPPRS